MSKNRLFRFVQRDSKREHRLLQEYPATLFFSPVEQAKNRYSSMNPPFFLSVLSTFLCVGIAFLAAALAMEPSRKYAKERHYNPIFFELSNVMTALMINLYGINCLLDEISREKSLRVSMIISMILGIVSTFPIFFIQQIEAKDSNSFSVMQDFAITVGSMPLQMLGFLEFCRTIYPRLENFYSHYVKCEENAERLTLRERDLFLKKLELGIDHCMTTNQMANLLALVSDEALIKTLLHHGEQHTSLSRDPALFQKMILALAGLVGVFLAQTVNLAFVKATFDTLAHKMDILLSSVLTCCVTFPAAVLSAEFGFNAMYQLLQSILSAAQLSNNAHAFDGTTPYVMPVSLRMLKTSLCLLLSSCSFAASVQFNHDLFKDDLTPLEMEVFDVFTIMGVLLFNNYVLDQVASHYLIMGLARSKDPATVERAKFHRFGQILLSEYRKINPSIIIDGIHNKLHLTTDLNLTTKADDSVDEESEYAMYDGSLQASF